MYMKTIKQDSENGLECYESKFINTRYITMVYIDYWDGYRVILELINGTHVIYQYLGKNESDKVKALEIAETLAKTLDLGEKY